MNFPSIVFLDLIGLVYDGNTLKKSGLGGSESAVILMSRELAALGFPVTVFNTCDIDGCSPGIYDGVEYRPIKSINENDVFDIAISLRTVQPFVPDEWYEAYDQMEAGGHAADKLTCSLFKKIRDNAELKILWMHDTFCRGDHNLEELVVKGYIDKIFTLSDFHTSYVSNCDHGKRRNFEVLKNHIFMTRNGVVRYIDEVDISQKDPELFVFNASISKGMMPLIDGIWPVIKSHMPNARLKVIGGFYRFRSNAPLDVQGEAVSRLMVEEKYKKLDIEFTGVIKQQEIAEILAKASFFLFPGSFPETFGISTLESLNYNTPLVCSRFGALEETAIDRACYKVDYAIEPNSLFTTINTQEQINIFIQTTLNAVSNRYLHQQKMYYCNVVKDISTWDTVALQWKQFFLKTFGLYMSAEEFRKVSYINDKVHRIFGRRFSNNEEWNTYKLGYEQPISVVTPLYNAEKYIEQCILSVASQDYYNYKMYLIDDCSIDNSVNVIKNTINNLPPEIQNKFILIQNEKNEGAVFNQIQTIRKNIGDDNIIMLIDGDDSLRSDNNIFNFYNNLFANGKTEYAYGSCWSLVDNIPLVAQPYPKQVRINKDYRNYKFNWGMPYPHLRVFKKYLLNEVTDDVFVDESGNWYRAGGDNATFYNIIEQADPDKVVAVQEIFYNYNDLNPLNDYKINGELQNNNAAKITKNNDGQLSEKKTSETGDKLKKILIAIPTSKNIEADTFKSIYDLIVPEGYETHYQHFYGYNVDQVRNLIAEWIVKGTYDYLLSVDYDIILPNDTLVKLLSHDKDIVSGIYRQRKHDQQIIEIFEKNEFGGYNHIDYDKIKDKGLVKVGACGFGCVLIKKQVMVDIGYPQFVYHSALNHSNTFSEDLDFCRKAELKNFEIYADTSILCEHIGSYIFRVS